MYRQRAKTIIGQSAVMVLACGVLILQTPTAIAELTRPLTTNEIIKQAETLFDGMVLSVQQAADDNHYQVQLLKASGEVITIKVNGLSGQMHEQKKGPGTATPGHPA